MTEGRARKSDRVQVQVQPAGHPSWVSVGGGVWECRSGGRMALCGLRVFGVYFCGFHVVNLHQTANYVVSIVPHTHRSLRHPLLYWGHFSKCGGTYPANNKVTAMRGPSPPYPWTGKTISGDKKANRMGIKTATTMP